MCMTPPPFVLCCSPNRHLGRNDETIYWNYGLRVVEVPRDGVVVIPQEIVPEVLVRSEEVVSTENLVRKDILRGVHPVDAYRKYGRF
jgi:hypothetical protein